jgi:hydrogenase maturation protein HypF
MKAAAISLDAPPDAIATRLTLPRALPCAFGMGAFLKASLCRIDGDQALLSRDAGDLSTLEAVDAYQGLMADIQTLGPIPKCAGHDMHPDFQSTRMAKTLGCATLPVQHHHAHILATQWEHGHQGPVLGLALDGFGLGPDNQSWGGELLAVDGVSFQRLGHLAPLPQPGGDIAAREPWRMASAVLHRLGRADEIAARFADQPQAGMLTQMLARRVNCPETTSCGRLFDAGAGLLSILPVAQFEGQAPMALEALVTTPEIMPDGWVITDNVLTFSPLLGHLPGMDPRDGANLFHGTLAAGLADLVTRSAAKTGLYTLALGGGCFLNKTLTGLLETQLTHAGMTVLKPARLPAGDQGLSFGQAVAAALWAEQNL